MMKILGMGRNWRRWQVILMNKITRYQLTRDSYGLCFLAEVPGRTIYVLFYSLFISKAVGTCSIS